MVDGPRKSRTPQQEAKREEVLSCLASGDSNREAAGKCGVDESTIRAWLKEEEFAAALEERLTVGVQHAERVSKSNASKLAQKAIKIALGEESASPQQVAMLRDQLTRLRVGAGQRLEISGGLAGESDEDLEAALRKFIEERGAGG